MGRSPHRSDRKLFQQLLQLLDELAKEGQGVVDGLGSGHIHAGDLQQGHRIGGAAAREELQIVLHGAFPLPQDAGGQGDGGGEPGGVLVDVEVAVEVGDAGPLDGDLRVNHHILAVVQLVQVVVQLAEALGGEGLPLLRHLVGLQLKLGEHGLAVDGGAELLQEVVDEHRPLPLVRGLLQQVLHQQGLVAGGGHLRHKEDIVGIDGGLILAAEVGVHGVAHLVGQGEGAVEVVLVVEQHEGVDRGADGVGAGALALVLIDVHPAVGEGLGQNGAVLLAQNLGGLQHILAGLVEGDDLVPLGEHGGVDVVHVQLIQPHGLLPQIHVAVHLVHVLVDGLDEVVVHALRHLHGVEGALEGAVILPGAGEEDVPADGGVEHGGQGVAAALVDAVEGLEGVLPQGAVGALHKGDVGAVGQGVLLPLAVGHGGELHVRVVIGVVDIAGAAAHLAGGSQQVLLGGGEDVVLLQPGLVQIPAVLFQLGHFLVKAVQGLVGDGHQLGAGEGRGAVQLHDEAEAPALHGLVGGVGGVLVVSDKGVDEELLRLLVYGLEPGQVGVQRLCALPKPALISRHLRRQALHALQLGGPRLIGGEQVGGVPADGGVHLAALEDLHILCHSNLLMLNIQYGRGRSRRRFYRSP